MRKEESKRNQELAKKPDLPSWSYKETQRQGNYSESRSRASFISNHHTREITPMIPIQGDFNVGISDPAHTTLMKLEGNHLLKEPEMLDTPTPVMNIPITTVPESWKQLIPHSMELRRPNNYTLDKPHSHSKQKSGSTRPVWIEKPSYYIPDFAEKQPHLERTESSRPLQNLLLSELPIEALNEAMLK